MRRQVFLIIASAFLAVATRAAFALPNWSFATLPTNGAVSGQAGTTVGWGYNISNADPLLWLSVTGFSADPFLNGVPDGSIFDFPVIAPSSTVSVAYDGIHGLYQLTWDAAAPTGFVNSGTFVLSGAWYDGDPFGAGIFVSDAADRSATYAAKVVAAPTSNVPEPTTLILLASGVLGFGVRRRLGVTQRARCN